MLSCKEVAQLLNSETQLSPLRRMSLWLHLMMCRPCAIYRKQIAAAMAAVRRIVLERRSKHAEKIREIEESVLNRYAK